MEMIDKFNIITLKDDIRNPMRFYIDLAVDTELEAPKIKRIEIPRSLAYYIMDLRDQIRILKGKL